jgi:prophage regulatory protein
MTSPLPRKTLPSGPGFRGHSPHTILRRRLVEAESGYSRSTIYLRISQGLWPRPISLGARAVGWPASEVAALNAARIAGLTDAKIRQLVMDLVAARHGAAAQADREAE